MLASRLSADGRLRAPGLPTCQRFRRHGSGSLPLYDGEYLAAHGPAVVVTINYRLGALGFINHTALSAEDPGGHSGNYGLQDMVAALRWVHDNISAFGGDPGRVLLYGASAGGNASCLLYTSPLAKGLFSAVAVESGTCGVSAYPAAAEQVLDQIAQNVGCAAGDLACLRSRPASQIITAYPTDYSNPASHRWAPIVDGVVIADAPARVLRLGMQNAVPLMVGSTAQEESTLLLHYLSRPIATDADYQAQVHAWFPVKGDRILSEYPSSGYRSPWDALVQVLTDSSFTCPQRTLARTAAAGPAAVYRYVFTHVT